MIRFGTPRQPGEGLRLGTVRRPPRGVRKEDYVRRGFYDVWMPELAPSAPIVSWALSEPWTDARWKRYARLYLKEMQAPAAQHLLELLVALSHQAEVSVGCYCEDETRCHRSLLRGILTQRGAQMAD